MKGCPRLRPPPGTASRPSQPPPRPVPADPTTRSDRGAFKTLLAAHAQLFVCSWEFLRKKEETHRGLGKRGGRARHLRCCGPAGARAAFPPQRRSPSGRRLRGAPRRGPHLGDALPSTRTGWARAGESRVPVRGRARPQRRDRGGDDDHERARLRGRPFPAWAAAAAKRPCLAGGGKSAAAGPRDSWGEEGGGRPPSRPPSSRWTRPARGSRLAPPSRASGARSPGIWRGPRARRGRAGPLPLPARPPPPRVPSGARGCAGSPLLSPALPRLRGSARPGQGQESGRRCPSVAGGSRSGAAAAGIRRPGPDSRTGVGAAEEPRSGGGDGGGGVVCARNPASAASPCQPASAAPPRRGAGEDGAGGPGPLGCPAACRPGAVQGSAGGRRGRLLLAAAGRDQLAAVLWLPLPGALRSGVPVQALREDWLLLFGSLCQLHLPVRPGLGGGPVPALPGQVQVSAIAGPQPQPFLLLLSSLSCRDLGVPGS